MKRLVPALLFSSAAIALAAPPKVTFTKSFPNSIPAYCSVEVDKTGALIYSESLTDDQPLKAQMPAEDAAQLFEMADKLGHFQSPLESGLKVANTGKKTFRYEDENGARTEVVFNYSLNLTAQQLLNRFENIAASERAYIALNESIHYDKLGINDALAEVEALWLNKELAAPRQFVPLLTRIATHESFMHIARDRAARLKDEFEAPTAANAADAKREAKN